MYNLTATSCPWRRVVSGDELSRRRVIPATSCPGDELSPPTSCPWRRVVPDPPLPYTPYPHTLNLLTKLLFTLLLFSNCFYFYLCVLLPITFILQTVQFKTERVQFLRVQFETEHVQSSVQNIEPMMVWTCSKLKFWTLGFSFRVQNF